jgi:hypothetical protein
MKIEELKSYREPTGGVVVNNSPYSTKYVIDFLLSELAAEVKKREEAEATLALTQWVEGEPPKPFRDEWFIAITTWGDKVVLRSLPEEYTYDYKTADDTYMKADKIKKWMQFPDSSFVPFAKSALAEAERRGMAKDAALAKIADAQNWFHTTDENGGPYTAWRGDGEPDQLAENAIRSAISK